MISIRSKHAQIRTFVVVACGGLMAAACSSGAKRSANDTASVPATTSVAAGLASPAPGTPPSAATAQMAALGDSIFHGQAAGGMCYTCHGADAKGTALAPPLLSHKWLTGDGTFGFIQQRVTQGMPNPTPPYTAAMPPMGGAHFSPDQIKAVAAYVYSIAHS